MTLVPASRSSSARPSGSRSIATNPTPSVTTVTALATVRTKPITTPGRRQSPARMTRIAKPFACTRAKRFHDPQVQAKVETADRKKGESAVPRHTPVFIFGCARRTGDQQEEQEDDQWDG